MSFKVVRTSKFRHVYGKVLKRDQCYDNIRVSKSSWDSTFCAVNPKFVAIIVESTGGGAFIVLPLNKVSRLPADYPLVGGHKGPVLDIAWCPHNDNLIASGSEDCIVRCWHIPDAGLHKTLTEASVELHFHQHRVGLVLWHPTALNVLLSASSDNQVVLWNIEQGEILLHVACHPDVVYSACFNWIGSHLVTTCKDKMVRVVNARTGEVEECATCHEGAKATRAVYLRNGMIFTTGFSKMSERQYSLRLPTALAEPLVMVELDTSNGVMFPLYDADTNLMYLCGKGDSVIRYFEITSEPPFVHFISTLQLTDPQRGIGMMPKRGCNVSGCEITRFYRLNNSGLCQVITMTVPRRSENFQDDLYPDTIGNTHALTAEQWFREHLDCEPVLISLQDCYKPPESKTVTSVGLHSRTQVRAKRDIGASDTNDAPATTTLSDRQQQMSSVSVSPPASTSHSMDKVLQDFADEIRKLKAMIVKHENRIRTLEAHLKSTDGVAAGSGGGGDALLALNALSTATATSSLQGSPTVSSPTTNLNSNNNANSGGHSVEGTPSLPMPLASDEV